MHSPEPDMIMIITMISAATWFYSMNAGKQRSQIFWSIIQLNDIIEQQWQVTWQFA